MGSRVTANGAQDAHKGMLQIILWTKQDAAGPGCLPPSQAFSWTTVHSKRGFCFLSTGLVLAMRLVKLEMANACFTTDFVSRS